MITCGLKKMNTSLSSTMKESKKKKNQDVRKIIIVWFILSASMNSMRM